MKKLSLILSIAFLIISTSCLAQQAMIDPNFNPIDNGVNTETGANGVVTAITVQPDGKIIIGGLFTAYNGFQTNYIARLTNDGLIDSSFIIGGSGINGSVSKIAVQSDGKILIGGSFTSYNGLATGSLIRLNANGSFDASFNNGGTGVGGAVSDIMVMNDFSIVVGGSFTTYNGVPRKYLIKLNPDGTSNESFNLTASRINKPVSCLAQQTDGKILVGGAVTSYDNIPVNYIFRILGTGMLDQGFVNTGEIANKTVKTIAIQNDGKILAGGSFKTVRMNADGSNDITYNIAAANNGVNGPVNKIIVEQDGKIVFISGEIKTTFYRMEGNKIHKRNEDGSNYYDFLYEKQYVNENFYSLAVQQDGKIIVGQEFIGQIPVHGFIRNNYVIRGLKRWNLLRYNQDGKMDDSFNLIPFITGANSTILASAVQSDGKIIIGGYFTAYNGEIANYVTRLNPDGSRDVTFNTDKSGPNNYVHSIFVESDGKIVICGLFTKYNDQKVAPLIRLNQNGSIDKTFDYPFDFVTTTKLYKSNFGKYYLASATGPTLSRILNNGSIDSTFNANIQGFLYSLPLIFDLNEKPDGGLIIAGSFYTVGQLRYPNFAVLDSNGIVISNFIGNTNDYVYASTIQPDGKIILGGVFTEYYRNNKSYISNKIVRIKADGSFDNKFNLGGTGFSGTSYYETYINFIQLQFDNKILVGGSFTSYNGHPVNNLVRLNEDGSYDESFNPYGFGANGIIRTICPIPNSNNFYIGGDFTSYNGVGKNRIARLTFSQPSGFVKNNSTENLRQPVNNSDETLNVFPNPSANSFNLQIGGLTHGVIKIKITDQAGRIVKQFNANAGKSISFGEELGIGIYFAQITHDNKTVTTRIVKL